MSSFFCNNWSQLKLPEVGICEGEGMWVRMTGTAPEIVVIVDASGGGAIEKYRVLFG